MCARYSGEYWPALDWERTDATAFVAAMTEAGCLGLPIPGAYGGSGLGLSTAAAILEDAHASGANPRALHAQMCTMDALPRHGSLEQAAT